MHSRGFAMFAYDSGTLGYGDISLVNALLIKKNLKMNNVALITSDDTINALVDKHGRSLVERAFDEIVITSMDVESSATRTFRDTRYSSFETKYLNGNRSSILDLTPFDETVLLDSDYLMLDSTMDLVWGSKEDLMCNSKLMDLDHEVRVERFNAMGIPVYWATAMYLRKNDHTAALFDHMRFVMENYTYYMDLYGFNANVYPRNDYALSISLHVMNGMLEQEQVTPLPTDYILMGDEFDDMHGMDGGEIVVTSERSQGNFMLHKIKRNLHVMNKRSILRNAGEFIAHATST